MGNLPNSLRFQQYFFGINKCGVLFTLGSHPERPCVIFLAAFDHSFALNNINH